MYDFDKLNTHQSKNYFSVFLCLCTYIPYVYMYNTNVSIRLLLHTF